MPFAVWCTTCKPHPTIIGQGVRFNAEKKKIGNYYSTPIYSFRMTHTVCGGTIEIQTDPKNTAYVVTEGGKKRDTGDDKELQPGEIAIKTHGLEMDPAEKDPFSKLEGKVEDKMRASAEASRILELQERQKRDWEDPYEMSKKLRRTFRAERKGLERDAEKGEALRDKMSLGIELVGESEGDRRKATMIEFGEDPAVRAAREARLKPMFEPPVASKKPQSAKRTLRTKKEEMVAAHKASVRNELLGNTRAAVDPFLVSAAQGPEAWKATTKRKTAMSSTPSIPKFMKKRKAVESSTPSIPKPSDDHSGEEPHTPTVPPKPALVDYSDSE
jgi:coiled-coil domain-containing protein 130